jgi:hypothetical protein
MFDRRRIQKESHFGSELQKHSVTCRWQYKSNNKTYTLHLPKSDTVGVQITVSVCMVDLSARPVLCGCHLPDFRILLHTNITLFVLPPLICRQYYTSISIGNPARPYFLDVDTGTDLTWIQCDAPCTNCTKVRAIFDYILSFLLLFMYTSPTAITVDIQVPAFHHEPGLYSCNQHIIFLLQGPHPLYKPAARNMVHPRDSVCQELQGNQNYCETCKQCEYEIAYADRSSSAGVLARDNMQLTPADGGRENVPFVFGYGSTFR